MDPVSKLVCASEIRAFPHLLADLALFEYILQWNVELAQVVLAEAIVVPTDTL